MFSEFWKLIEDLQKIEHCLLKNLLRAVSFVAFYLTWFPSSPQFHSSLENQKLCKYSRCGKQQPNSHCGEGQNEVGESPKTTISRELFLFDLFDSALKITLTELVFIWPHTELSANNLFLRHLSKTFSGTCLTLQLPEVMITSDD